MPLTQKQIIEKLNEQLEKGDKSLLPAIQQVSPELFTELPEDPQKESVRLIKIITLQATLLKSRTDKQFREDITGVKSAVVKAAHIYGVYIKVISKEIQKIIGENKHIKETSASVIDAIIRKDVVLRSKPQETSLLDQADKPELKKQHEPMPPVNAIREKTQQEEPSVLPVVEKAAAVDVLKEPGQHVDVPLGVQQPARPVHTAVPEPGEETQKKEEPSALPVVGKVAALDVQKETVQHVDTPLVPQAEQPVRTDVTESVTPIRKETQQEHSVLPVVDKAAPVDVLKEPGQHVDAAKQREEQDRIKAEQQKKRSDEARKAAIDLSKHQIQLNIDTFEKFISISISNIEATQIPTAYKLLSAMKEAFLLYKEKIGTGSASQDRALALAFKTSCEEANKNINDKGLALEPRVGDATNNFLNSIVNALNHLISSLHKLCKWDSSYTLFERRDYTSPELRFAFRGVSSIGKIPENTEQDILKEEPKDDSNKPPV